MNNHEVYVKAKTIILFNGWQRGTLGYSGDPRCLRGAFMEAIGPSVSVGDHDLRLNSVEREFRSICDIRLGVPQWNDHSAQNKAHVIRMLDKCIEATRPPSRIPSQDLRVFDSAHHFYLE